MYLAYVIVAVLLSLALVASGVGKLSKQERIVEGVGGLGVPLSWFPFLGGAEILGAVGLVVGIWWAPAGIAAAIGVILYFVGAVIAHVRAGDSELVAPVVLGLIAVAALALRILSL